MSYDPDSYREGVMRVVRGAPFRENDEHAFKMINQGRRGSDE